MLTWCKHHVFFCFFFCEEGPNWDPRTQGRWPIALYISFKFIGGCLGVQSPYRGPRFRSASLFYLFWIHPGKVQGLHLYLFQHRAFAYSVYQRFLFCTGSPAWGSLALLILCSMYCRLICRVRSPTNILQCFLSSLLRNWTYLSDGLSRHSWLVPYFSQTFHSVCFLSSIQFLILDLNLLNSRILL